MKLTFEHGLDSFRWNDHNQPAPGKTHRDTGIEFWLDGRLLQAVAENEDNPVAKRLVDVISEMLIVGEMTKGQIRDKFRAEPELLPDGIEL